MRAGGELLDGEGVPIAPHEEDAVGLLLCGQKVREQLGETLGETLGKIINDGANGLICILL